METTVLVVAGKKLKVPRLLKRALQVAVSVGLTLLVVLVILVGDGLLAGKASSLQTAIAAWLGFVKRPDMLAIMSLTALVTVLFVYWQRDQERSYATGASQPTVAPGSGYALVRSELLIPRPQT